jgi:hypothetical protein
MTSRRRESPQRVLLATLAVWALAAAAVAAPPAMIQYQGKLLDAGGAPVPDGSYGMELRFYDDCVAGNLLLTDVHPAVATVNGIYNLMLGGGLITPGLEPDLASVFEFHDTVCLGLTVAGDSEMVPRQQLLSVPYALRAGRTDGAVGSIATEDDLIWTGTHTFEKEVNLLDENSIVWPHTSGNVPPAAHFRILKFVGMPPGQELHPNGEGDEQIMICYNCPDYGTFPPEDPSQHQFNVKYEMTYFDGNKEVQEQNWNLRNPVIGHIVEGYDGGSATAMTWRQFAMRIQITPSCQNATNEDATCSTDADCNGAGAFCGGQNRADYGWTGLPVGYCSNDHQVLCTDETAALDCGIGNSCTQRFDFKIRMDGKIESRRGLDVLTLAGADLDAEGEAEMIRIDAEVEPSSTGGLVLGIQNVLDYDGDADPGSSLDEYAALSNRLVFSGSTDSRSITGSMIGVDTELILSQTGAASMALPELFGHRSKPRYTGANLTVNEYAGFYADVPSDIGSITVERHYGLRIDDQLGKGTVEDAAIVVSPQSGADAAKGNVWLQGGGWQDGHLQLGAAHLWYDSGSQSVRVSAGAPTAAGDGSPLHAPPGSNVNWGGMYWGDENSSAHDSGNEVCALAGLSCLETYDMGASNADSCSTTNHGTDRFLVLCY